jgi:hypothetical protein
MKTLHKTIGLLLLVTTIGFTTVDKYLVTPGVGTETLQVGHTKISKALQILGKNDKFTEGIIDGTNYAIHINRYIYTKLGLTIISHTYEQNGEDLDNALIDNIQFESPASVTLNNGVKLGVDTYETIITKFGNPDTEREYKFTHLLFYDKKGISFTTDKATKKIIKIEVYKVSGRWTSDDK